MTGDIVLREWVGRNFISLPGADENMLNSRTMYIGVLYSYKEAVLYPKKYGEFLVSYTSSDLIKELQNILKIAESSNVEVRFNYSQALSIIEIERFVELARQVRLSVLHGGDI